MAEIQYDREIDGFLFKTGVSQEFASPASQETLLKWNRHNWEASNGSRSKQYPYWNRPDLFRTMNFFSTIGLTTRSASNLSQSSIALPSGNLKISSSKVPATLILPDNELYNYQVQKLFCIFSQFDTITEYQLSTLMNLPVEEIREYCNILYSQGIIKDAEDYDEEEKIGKIWIFDEKAEATHDYQDGMDALYNLFSFGNESLKDIRSPGSASPSSIKHNLYVAETCIRLAECGDNIAGIWGDTFTGESMFHEPNPNVLSRRSHGDGAVVTKDGSVIVFEMVGSSSDSTAQFKKLVEKAASWVGVISNSDIDLNVLFLDAAWSRDRRNLIAATNHAVFDRSVAYTSNEFDRKKAMSHIGLVNLTHWFPDDNTVSKAATRLEAWCPALREAKSFDLPDPLFSNKEVRKSILINSACALHTPEWMRGDIHEQEFRRINT